MAESTPTTAAPPVATGLPALLRPISDLPMKAMRLQRTLQAVDFLDKEQQCTTSVEQVLDVPERQWEADVEHHRPADDLRAGL